jgi:hypothetical protein
MQYIVLMFLSTVLAIILRFYGGPILVDMYIYNLELCTSDRYALRAWADRDASIPHFVLLHLQLRRIRCSVPHQLCHVCVVLGPRLVATGPVVRQPRSQLLDYQSECTPLVLFVLFFFL